MEFLAEVWRKGRICIRIDVSSLSISTGIDNEAINKISNQSSVKTCQGNLPKDLDSRLGREGPFSYMLLSFLSKILIILRLQKWSPYLLRCFIPPFNLIQSSNTHVEGRGK